MTTNEQWRDLSGKYKGRYQVSSHGRLRSLRFINGARNQLLDVPRILSPGIDKKFRYHAYSLSFRQKIKRVLIHRLVLETFVGKCPTGYECAHLDGNRANNHLDNLKWVTPKENQSHRKIHGTYTYGEFVTGAKLTEIKVREIRLRHKQENVSYIRLATEYGVVPSTLRNVVLGINWRHVQ